VGRPAAAGPVGVCAVGLRPGTTAGGWHVLAGTAGDEVWLVALPHLRTAPNRYNSRPAPDGSFREYRGVGDGVGGRLRAVECLVQAHPPAPARGGGGACGDLAAHPAREDEFATCGADGVLRVWDAAGCRPVLALTLHHALADPDPPPADVPADPDPDGGGGADPDGGAATDEASGGAASAGVGSQWGAGGGAGAEGGEGWGAWSLVAAEYSGEWGDRCHLAVAMVPRPDAPGGAGAGPGRASAERSQVAVLRVSDAQAGGTAPLVCVLARRAGLGGRRATCLRYSAGGPDGAEAQRVLAVGTWEGAVVVFDADLETETYVRRAVLRGHARPVAQLDFAAGPEPGSLQSSSAWELKFWDLAAGRARKAPSADRDTRWWATARRARALVRVRARRGRGRGGVRA
jgi:hypothetical protein